MPSIKTITFDLDDTLWDLKPVLIGAENTCFDWLCQRAPELQAQFDLKSFMKFRMGIYHQQPELAHQISDLRKVSVALALEQLGYSPAEAKQISLQAFDLFLAARHQVTLFDGVEALLAQLKTKYRLGALTNGNADIRKLPISHYFDYAFSAEQLNASKPAPDLFLAALKTCQAEPQELIHIGDHIEHDIQGAVDAGCHAIWFNPEGKILPEEALEVRSALNLSDIPNIIADIERQNLSDKH